MIDAVITYFSGTFGMLELIATVLLILNVYLLAKQKIINFWFGAVGVAIYGYIFLEFKLYSDMLLQWAYFLPTQILGWYWWKTLGNEGNDSLPVTILDNQTRLAIVVGILSWTVLIGYLMSTYTDASFPYADALTTVMSVIANFLLLRKIWENWVIWVVMDVIAINIYYMKGLYVTSGLYIVFLSLATYGLIRWWKDYNEQETEHA